MLSMKITRHLPANFNSPFWLLETVSLIFVLWMNPGNNLQRQYLGLLIMRRSQAPSQVAIRSQPQQPPDIEDRPVKRIKKGLNNRNDETSPTRSPLSPLAQTLQRAPLIGCCSPLGGSTLSLSPHEALIRSLFESSVSEQ